MPRPPAAVPRELALQPFSRRTALEHAVTDRTLRGPSYRSVLRGAHACADLHLTYGHRIRAARAVLPPQAVLGGRSALWAWGVRLAEPDEPVEVVLPPTARVRNRAEIRIRADVLRPGEAVPSRWGPVTTPARTAFDLGRRGVLRQSVPLLDALARATGVTAEDVDRLASEHRGARHLTRLAPALTEMDGRAESLRESLLRLLVVEAGFPRPTLQHTVRDAGGRFVARVDLAWPELRLALEYDGSHHDDPGRIALDRRRLNALHTCGWRTLVIDRHQLRDEARVVDMIRILRKAAAGS
ncbi:type IV toxin-antitoxin system AbiEi family antitoxin [Cellulomonas aerilata]|uniref:type IV toxin-antitoxin system AbiEi family antitoxin n=1 Tax=Cellulomonas aerilata TaxID=515326 RepID=UPI001649A268|nr:type IV toxin-antitoxin system AbiEi family antitoxin [Cellulomonas aerilata]